MLTEDDVRNSLEDLPDTLKDAYDEIYSRIVTQKRSAPGIALNAFRWIQCASVPLRSSTLLEAITPEVGNRVKTNDLLRACQNLVILDDGLDVFRFAHLSVDEYLETRLPTVYSHAMILKGCLEVLNNPNSWGNYMARPKYKERDYYPHLLLYSTIFWPWHFSRCEDPNIIPILNDLWNSFTSGSNYQDWLKYHRCTVEGHSSAQDIYWRRVDIFQRQQSDDILFSFSAFGLNQTFSTVLKSRPHIEQSIMNQLLFPPCEFGDLEIGKLLISVLNRPVRRPGTAVPSEFLLGRTGRRKIRPSRHSI